MELDSGGQLKHANRQDKRSLSLLQVILFFMKDFLVTACKPFVNEQCCRSIVDLTIFHDSECRSLVISKAIGFGLIGFSAILKIPQLIQIIINKSGQGLSITSIFMEIIANVLHFSYHRFHRFPISTFGESALILIQNVLIAFFVTHFDDAYNHLVWNGFIALNSCLLFVVERQVVSERFISILWAVCLPLSIAYKVPQIWHTYKAKCKGELSILSCALTLLGSLGRVFTTLREIPDWTVLLMYLMNVVLNGTILIESIIYPKRLKESHK